MTGQQMQTAQYELPDGKIIEVGAERFKACELLFNPSLLEPERCGIFGVDSPSQLHAVQVGVFADIFLQICLCGYIGLFSSCMQGSFVRHCGIFGVDSPSLLEAM